MKNTEKLKELKANYKEDYFIEEVLKLEKKEQILLISSIVSSEVTLNEDDNEESELINKDIFSLIRQKDLLEICNNTLEHITSDEINLADIVKFFNLIEEI